MPNPFIYSIILSALLSACASSTPTNQPQQWTLEAISLYSSDYEDSTEIVAIQASSLRAAVSNSKTGEVDILDISNPYKLKRIARFSLHLNIGEELTSVDFHPTYDMFAVVIDTGLTRGRVQLHSASTGALIDTTTVGYEPDAIVFAKQGHIALIANEGEDFWFDPKNKQFFSAEGSVSIIHINKTGKISAHNELALADITNHEGFVILTNGHYLKREIDWNGDHIISHQQDFNHDGLINNKKVLLGSFEGHPVFGNELKGEAGILIPIKSYSPALLEPEYIAISPDAKRAYVTLQEENAVAVVDLTSEKIIRYFNLGSATHTMDSHADGWIQFDQSQTSTREPDGIATIVNGRYFVTADEGDADFATKEPEDNIFSGGRSVSVFDAYSGNFVGDTGNQLDEIAYQHGVYPELRSNKKGIEPEMVVSFEMAGKDYVVVDLERAGAIVLIDMSEPTQPKAIALGKIPGDEEKSPEGIAHFTIDNQHYILTANEMNGTVACFKISTKKSVVNP
ncbi:MAG: hypothetical protein K9L22_12850 [Methylococcaceae bacterium]|nr:hypothetical protein [Methylococcaceae bacterium]